MQRTCLRTLLVAVSATALWHTPAFAQFNYLSARYGDGSTQMATGVATDNVGNIIVVGSFAGTVNFGGANLTSAGSYDIFVAKFSQNGTHLWSQSYGDGSQQEARAVKTDAAGNIFVVGHFLGAFIVAGNPFTSAGGTDVYYLKFSSAGTFLAGQRFGDAGWQYCSALAMDSAGSFGIAGAFTSSVNFGGGALVSAGDYDIFVAKFNSSGAHLWSKRFGDGFWQDGTCIVFDTPGNVVVGGHFSGTVNFGGSNLTGNVDAFLVKLSAIGNHVWSKSFGDNLGQYCNGVAIDYGTQNIIMAGYMDGTFSFGGANVSGTGNIYLAKFNPSGGHLWSYDYGDDAGSQDVRGIACDGSGNIVIAGHMNGSVDFGGGVLTTVGAVDLIYAKFDPNGAHLWSRRHGDGADQQDPRVATGVDDDVLLAGYFAGTVNFGGPNLTSAGSYDIFVARIDSYTSSPLITSVADIGNDQGRKVKIRFVRNRLDKTGAAPQITRYDAFRRDDPPPAASAMQSAPDDPTLIDGWTQVGSVNAYGENSYGIDVPTVGDSTVAQGQYLSTFFIRAATATPASYYDSNHGVGYSLDNLAPGVPSSFVYGSGQLAWDEATAEDFDYFSVYGSNTDAFGSATFIDYTVDPALDVSAAPYTYYFVTATDFSGNEGKPAAINTLSDVGNTPRSYVLSVSSYPNPFNPKTTIRYTLPSRGRVAVDVYDLRGAHVVALVNEDRSAGAHTLEWNGRDGDGVAVSSGVYFARLTHPSGTRSYKMVLLK